MKCNIWILYNLILFIILLCPSVTNNASLEKTILEHPEFRLLYYHLRNIISSIGNSLSLLKPLERQKKAQDKIRDDVPFPCNIQDMRSVERPKSIHQLRPGDIDVVGAVGDSLMSANGALATNLFQVFTEYRGVSWSIGGKSNWRQYLTLPNIIKVFNPNLIGYSYDHGSSNTNQSQFNVAELGATSDNLQSMIEELAKRIKNDERVNFQDDWKMITVMIGANDICNLCYLKDPESAPQNHQQDLIKMLRYIRDNIPRTFVNLVVIPDLNQIFMTKLPPLCRLTQAFECTCLFGQHRKQTFDRYSKILYEWQMVEEIVANMNEFTNSDTFTVVPQLFLKRAMLPTTEFNTTDLRYLSVDCFHISQRGYARAANGLWNNLLEPIRNKSVTWPEKFLKPFLCPTEKYPYICTAKNNCQ